MTNQRPLSACLKADALVKDFGNGKGVFNVSLAVNSGEIVGFIGPNGSGKSTTINILTGLIRPQRGKLQIFGETVNSTSIYRHMPRIGAMFSEQTIENELTAQQIFTHSAQLLGKDCTDNWQKMSAELELDTSKKVKKLSLGNKKKVGVINALMHEPDLLIMDEPTSGLDPLIRNRFVSLLNAATDRGAAVLLSSHDLGEVQQACDRIIMIKEGAVILSDTTENILNHAGRTFRMSGLSEKLMREIEKLRDIKLLRRDGKETVFQVKDKENLLKLLVHHKFYDFYIERPTLEDAFEDSYQ